MIGNVVFVISFRLHGTTNSIVVYSNVFNEKVFILFVKDLKRFYSILYLDSQMTVYHHLL